MKACIQIKIITLALLFFGTAQAAQVSVTFDNVPPQVQCGQTWTNNNVVLCFNQTTDSEGNTAGYCSYEVDPGYVWLYPARLLLDFSLLSQPVTSIEADVQAYGNTGLFGYSGTTNIGRDQTPNAGTLSLAFTNPYPDLCAISSSEGVVSGITISAGVAYPPTLSIQQTGDLVTVSWPTNNDTFTLETSSDLTNPAGWTSHTSNIGIDGTDFFYTVAVPSGSEYFRLRH